MILRGCFIRQWGRRPRAQRFRISSWPLAKGARGSRDTHASPHHTLHSLLGAKVAPCLGTWEKPQMGVCLVSNDIIVFRNSSSQDHWARRRGAKPIKIQGIWVGWRPKALLVKSLCLLGRFSKFFAFLKHHGFTIFNSHSQNYWVTCQKRTCWKLFTIIITIYKIYPWVPSSISLDILGLWKTIFISSW